MPTCAFNIEDISVISTDWHNFKQSIGFAKEDLSTFSDRIDNHPCIRLISVHFLFSYYKKKRMEAFPEYTIHENCIRAMCDIEEELNRIFNYTPE